MKPGGRLLWVGLQRPRQYWFAAGGFAGVTFAHAGFDWGQQLSPLTAEQLGRDDALPPDPASCDGGRWR